MGARPANVRGRNATKPGSVRAGLGEGKAGSLSLEATPAEGGRAERGRTCGRPRAEAQPRDEKGRFCSRDRKANDHGRMILVDESGDASGHSGRYFVIAVSDTRRPDKVGKLMADHREAAIEGNDLTEQMRNKIKREGELKARDDTCKGRAYMVKGMKIRGVRMHGYYVDVENPPKWWTGGNRYKMEKAMEQALTKKLSNTKGDVTVVIDEGSQYNHRRIGKILSQYGIDVEESGLYDSRKSKFSNQLQAHDYVTYDVKRRVYRGLGFWDKRQIVQLMNIRSREEKGPENKKDSRRVSPQESAARISGADTRVGLPWPTYDGHTWTAGMGCASCASHTTRVYIRLSNCITPQWPLIPQTQQQVTCKNLHT